MGDNGTNGICVKLLIKATIRPQNILRITNDIGMYMEKIHWKSSKFSFALQPGALVNTSR